MQIATVYGLLASLFFAVTFILNRSMNLAGDSFLWSASLRFSFMLPILFLIVARRNQTAQVHAAIKEKLFYWMLWSSIGFGLFYLPLTFAASCGEAWLIAGLWQVTIVAGALLSPLWGVKVPMKNLGMAIVILSGVFLLQMNAFTGSDISNSWKCITAVLAAAFSYPLGNRKMMRLCDGKLNTLQRVYGMTLCSMPFWLAVSSVAWFDGGIFSCGQALQSLLVALFSGVIATLFFFKATEIVMHDMKRLAIVEATQAGEVIFSLIGGCLLLGDNLPDASGFSGLLLIIGGMLINSLSGR